MTNIPANAKTPADRKAKAEAEQSDITVEIAGLTLTLERDAVDDVEFLEALEDEKNITAFRLMLGVAQWAGLKDALRDEKGKVRPEALGEAMEAALEAIGGAGNSGASPTS